MKIRNHISVLFFFLMLMTLVISCQKEELNGEDPEGQLLVIPPGFPDMDFPDNNQLTRERWELGKKLFFDPILSRDGSLSCGSCHKPELAFADDRAFSPGVENRPGTRNAPSLGNIGYHPYFLREGSVPTLEMQALVPVQEHNEFDHSMPAIADKLNEIQEYVRMSNEAYNRDPDPWVITRALGVFQRTLISGDSPFDRYHFRGNRRVLTDSQRRGMELFFSERLSCGNCHGGFNFTNYNFENNGLDSIYADRIRGRFTLDPGDDGRAKVPSLRNVAVTSPYMHDGRFNSLAEVVEHYNSGGYNHPNKSDLVKPLHLSTQEKQDLIKFLESLTDYNFINQQNH